MRLADHMNGAFRVSANACNVCAQLLFKGGDGTPFTDGSLIHIQKSIDYTVQGFKHPGPAHVRFRQQNGRIADDYSAVHQALYRFIHQYKHCTDRPDRRLDHRLLVQRVYRLRDRIEQFDLQLQRFSVRGWFKGRKGVVPVQSLA
ncbi:hypothetical protein D3C73_1251290 [compost metagenome]